MQPTPKSKKRFVIYVEDDMHRQLRSTLALQDTDVAKWFRDKAQQEIDKRRKAGDNA
jgi:hypothetical protein